MSIPLLTGVSKAKMLEISGKTKFHFVKFAKGEKLFSAGAPCTHINCILDGTVNTKTEFSNPMNGTSITLSQTFQAPTSLCIEYLFGTDTTFPCDATAIDNINVLQIDKLDYMKIIAGNQIFMFNYLNNLSASIQSKINSCTQFSSGFIAQRIAYLISINTQRFSSEISLTTDRNTIPEFFNISETEYNAAMEALRAIGLIEFNNALIIIKNRKDFLDLFSQLTSNK